MNQHLRTSFTIEDLVEQAVSTLLQLNAAEAAQSAFDVAGQ